MSEVGKTWRRRFTSSAAVAATAALLISAAASPVAAAEGNILGTGNPDAIPGSYLVVLKENSAVNTQSLTRQLTRTPSVANMSLGAAGSHATLENAVRNSINRGVVYAIASGNSNSDACNFTPARIAEVITVSSSTRLDTRASSSNWGRCVNIFAPGVDITSAWHTSDTATATISGTSMAAPHVAGAAALIIGNTLGLTPAQVVNIIYTNATPNKITNPGPGSPNLLLYIPPGTSAPSPTAQEAVRGPDWSPAEHF